MSDRVAVEVEGGAKAAPHVGDARLREQPGAYRHCITLRCGLECAWCALCRSESPDGTWSIEPEGEPGDDATVILLHGGDAFRHGALGRWMRWARRNPRAWVELEGPVEALADPEGSAVVARILESAPDGATAIVPSRDALARAHESLRALSDGLALRVAIPVGVGTVREVSAIVRAVDALLGARVEVLLRRAPTRRAARRRLPLLADGDGWSELDDLSAQLSLLPAVLPGGARLRMDPDASWPPCTLRAGARRSELIRARADDRPWSPPFPDLCARCAWRARCAWQPDAGAPSPARVLPLDDDDVRALQRGSLDAETAHLPHAAAVRMDRGALGIPDLLCVAPWTSMSVTEHDVHPVPCAISWVDNDVAHVDAAAAMELPTAAIEALAARADAKGIARWYCLDNEELSLDALWNNPLLRRMRRQMRDGGPSRHCRSMCRVIMGVEDRSVDLLARRDADLTPAIVENRRRLVDELREGRDFISARPLELTLGVASHCNITCGFCRGPEGRFGELSDRRRDEVATWLPTLMSFTVSGPGEPLMSANYLKILEIIAREGFPSLGVGLTTNGTLLTPAFLERHRRVRWSHVRISLNAGSPRTHERMTGKQLFDRVRANLDALCALRDGSDPPFAVTLSCVLSELVMGDLHRFAELVTSYKTQVVVEPMYGNLEGLSPWVHRDRLALLADELAAVARDFELRSPALARAFEAVHRFARERLAGDDLSPLRHR